MSVFLRQSVSNRFSPPPLKYTFSTSIHSDIPGILSCRYIYICIAYMYIQEPRLLITSLHFLIMEEMRFMIDRLQQLHIKLTKPSAVHFAMQVFSLWSIEEFQRNLRNLFLKSLRCTKNILFFIGFFFILCNSLRVHFWPIFVPSSSAQPTCYESPF